MHRGFFERADGGTLLLDEITEMAPDMQARLLRVLETGRYTRVGGEQELRARARIIAATNRDVRDAVRDGSLREDLMYRLAVFPIALPPLRERDGDPELLAEHFLRQLNDTEGAQKMFSRQAIALIRSHRWPGNVRELKNAVQRAFILCEGIVDIDVNGLACAKPEGRSLTLPVGLPLADIEKRVICSTLDLCDGNKRRCAEMLGVIGKTSSRRPRMVGRPRLSKSLGTPTDSPNGCRELSSSVHVPRGARDVTPPGGGSAPAAEPGAELPGGPAYVARERGRVGVALGVRHRHAEIPVVASPVSGA